MNGVLGCTQDVQKHGKKKRNEKANRRTIGCTWLSKVPVIDCATKSSNYKLAEEEGGVMALTVESELRNVTGVAPDQLALIKAFLQGAVYSWVKNRRGEQFAGHDLVGGANFDWTGTPLRVLYDKHVSQGKAHDAAVDAAGIDLGWILKSVLHSDRRTFEAADKGLVRGYRWIESPTSTNQDGSRGTSPDADNAE